LEKTKLNNLPRIFLIIFFFSSCRTERIETVIVNLEGLKKYSLTEEHTSILLLKSFILDKDCEKSDNRKYANAFLCSVPETGDTIIVLNICEKASDFLSSNYDFKSDNDLILDSGKVAKQYPKEVVTNIDSNIYSRHYPFIVADIIKLLY
jgi:hypothetical protein